MMIISGMYIHSGHLAVDVANQRGFLQEDGMEFQREYSEEKVSYKLTASEANGAGNGIVMHN